MATQGLAALEKQLDGLQRLVGRRVVMHSHKEPGLDGSVGMVEAFDSSTRLFTVKLDNTALSVPPEVSLTMHLTRRDGRRINGLRGWIEGLDAANVSLALTYSTL